MLALDEMRVVAGDQVPYLEAALKEALRLIPPAGQGTLREAKEDFELGGFTIPKGSSINVSLQKAALRHNVFFKSTGQDACPTLMLSLRQADRWLGCNRRRTGHFKRIPPTSVRPPSFCRSGSWKALQKQKTLSGLPLPGRHLVM